MELQEPSQPSPTPKTAFNRDYVLAQIRTCEQVIMKYQGVLEMCQWQLENIDFGEVPKESGGV